MPKKAYMLLIALLLFLSLTQSVHAQGYDYVDSDTSDVDGVPDIGTHSNFVAQQLGPDSVFDTLVEENVVGGIIHQSSAESYSAVGSSSHSFAYSLMKGSGNNRLIVVTISWEDAQASASISSLTFGGTAMTKIADVTASGGYSEYISLWYLLDSNLPSNPGSYVIAVAVSETITREIYVAVAEYSGVRQSAPDDYDTHALTGSGSTAITLTAVADGSVVVAGVGEGGTNALTNTNNINNLQQQILTSSGSALGHHINASSGDITVGWNSLSTREGMVGAVWQPATNYKLDLEVQWTNATYDLPNAELCVFGGTMGAEDVRVDAWIGATWQNLFTDLSSGWNNVSITDILVGSTFTIRFNGGTETGDSSQDSWQIDTTLLHAWGAPPIALFSFTPSSPYTGETVTFNASTSSDPDGTIANYFWTFGDGTNGTGEIITHIYADNGIYTTTLTVTDNDGLVGTASANITVLNRSPVVSFTESAETVSTGEPIYFNASSSYDTDGSVVSYFWDFGDGSNATDMTVQHVYADDGTYTVTLTVTDNDGAVSSTTATKTVLNRAPVAMFTESVSTAYTGENIQFNASSSYDPDGSIVSYFWTFGDGTNATGSVVSHAYADNGSYVVTLIVTDDDGSISSETATKMALNRSPLAVFTESAETVETGEAITFNASSSYDPDGIIVSYFWDFGDGTNSTGTAANHVYTDDGVYTVTLTVTDDDGATASTSATKTILNKSPTALFTESLATAYTDEVIDFNASASYDPDGLIVGYFWDFGDGSNATGVFATHMYSDNGVYNVTLTVTDDDGATDTVSSTKTVANRPPVASFTESSETVYIGQPITFNASGSYDPDGTIASFYWDFGDTTNATGPIVSHTYSVNGTFTVTLTVVDDDGSSSSTSVTKTILYNSPPVALFTESTATAYTADSIIFNASSSYDSDGSIVDYFWDFGDGTNTTGTVVAHAYADNGIYTVTLTVTDNLGAIGSSNSIKTILNRSPIASFTESTEAALTGEIIYFNASSSYDPDGSIVSYFWDFGDGTNATGVAVNHAYIDDGAYTVTLSVTDDDGATTALNATKTIQNRSPVASFTESAVTLYSGEVVVFNASSSYDPDGTILTYSWDFGDGTNATGIVVSQSYGDDGIYTVVLTVTDNDGATSNALSTKTVLNRSPVASFTESATTAYTSDVIHFNASSSYDSDGSVVSYFWDFGDGTNASGVTSSHAYVEDGVYTTTLTVTDNDGAATTATATKTILNMPPIASFTESATLVLTSEVIHFNASGSYDPDGTIVNYLWNFGDGTNATGITVDHSYLDNGTYIVTLTVTDNDGGAASVSATKTVFNRSPVASFTESATSVYTSEPITLNATASYDPDGFIVNYTWNFGDGNITTVANPVVTHAYADNGTYTVTLTVTDNDGATSTTSSTKTVLNRPPVASFTESTTTVFTGEVIYFNASSSYDLDGSIVSYFWNFSDGTNATGITVSHVYTDNGIYTVTLTVTDNDGATATASSTKTVLNRPPVATFTESATTAYKGEVIRFNASASYDPDGSIVSYFWDFGDGTNASGVIIDHPYTNVGTYTVTLTVTDNDGTTASTTAVKTVLNRPPVASFTESATTVYTGDVINFNASASYDPDGVIVSYFWTFGDGTNATGVAVTHACADNGTYVVTLTVTDNDGATASKTATKTVLNRSPVASFTESATTVYTGEVIYFNASASYDPDGSIVSYFWNFGDGANATGMTVNHAYADNGIYTVTLTVTDNDGTTGTATATKTVVNRPPVASFTENATTVLTGVAIRFNASGSYDPDGSIVSYFWNFGDGVNATGIVVDHAYLGNGVYTVTLTVTDNDGGTATSSATKTVLNRSPVASFTESATTVYTGDSIILNASSSYDPDGTIISYRWDFGDGTNATGMMVNHAYADNGTYTVTLVVTDDDGATNSVTATKTVLNRPPVASFTESAETVYTGEVIWFNASSSYDSDGYTTSYSWTFGDGASATGIYVNHTYAQKGNYTVTLTIIDDDGASSLTSAVKTVLNRPPVSVFTESAQTVYTGKTITFDASNSYDPDGTVVSYFWNFGDGATATGVTVGHAYGNNGNYTVTLTVTDNDGATDSATSVKTILNRAPVASSTASATMVYTGTAITFNASESYDSDGIITSYFWNFGDGATATGAIVAHAYADNGSYVVRLTVTDDDGATGTSTITINVLNRAPTASFTESATTVYTGETINFNASASYDPDGSIISYFWDFGDGTNATGVAVDHLYSNNGSYTVTLRVTDNDGAINTKIATKTVLNRPPTALFTESAQSATVDEVIYFNASASYDLDGSIVSYFWTFGDGANATGVTAAHAYSAPGVYTVVLTVTDDDGAQASQSATKTVAVTPPVAVFTESAQTVYTGETITFNASNSYDPDGSIVSYFWDFGDNTNATGVVVTHAYVDDRNYTVTLTVSDNDGATDMANAIKTVLNRPPVASFTESAQTVYMGQPITFNASSSYDPDGGIVSYFWAFGDGTNTTGIVAEHTYSINGTYTVTLTVVDNDAASNSTSATKTIIWNEKPVASFTESAETVLTGEVVYFNASASYDIDGNVTGYFWSFGDSSNATGVVVEHSYANNGNYTVTLTVIDNVGAAGTAMATKTVLNRQPVANFTESTEIAYTGEVITFNATYSYDYDGFIVEYFWDFGDGTNTTGVIVSHSYADNGTYNVTLTVTDDDAAYNSTTAIKTILNSPPVAVFSESAETVYTGQSITFNASNSYDPDGIIVSYFWDFRDGTNATGMVVTHTYALNGTFTVTLNITDEDGGVDVATATKTILLNQPPAALFTESAETIYQGETISFNASNSYDLDSAIVGYFWDFGDGTNATGVAVDHVYVDDGNYTVTLTVTDDRGAEDTVSSVKTVLNKIPVVTFTESATTVYDGVVISFNASASYDADGFIVSYAWNFGDGTSATGTVVSHAYDDDGVYVVTLTLTDDDEGISSASATKTILNRSPVASFTMSPSEAYTGEIVVFNASGSYDVDGLIVSYFWDFGDGQTGYGKIVSHAFADNRLYVIALTVTDDDLATNRLTAKLFILNRSPVASFVESAQTSYIGTPIGFDASGSYDVDGSIVGYSWSFGDGTTATGVTTNHIYMANGTYTVSLTVTDNDGASNSVQAAKTILENTLPVASFTESLQSAFTGEAIAFDASTSYDPDGSIATYFWSFGDGSNASGAVVEHVYTNDGSYTVTLVVTDDKWAQDTATATKTIQNRLPVASFSESLETAYAYETIVFDASSSYDFDGSISSFFWDFGDGTNATGEVTGHAYSVNSTFTVTLTVTDNDGGSSSVQATKTILGGMRDVKIVDVIPAATEIYKHRVLDISVVVTNEGTEVETFNVTLFFSEIYGWHLIEVDSRLAWYSDVENSADFLLRTSTAIPADNPILTFETKYDTENLYDFCFVQVSTDEGVTWVSLENAYTTHNHALDTEPDIVANLPGLSGTSTNWPGWRTMSFDLSAYAGQTVLLGFRYMTDSAYAKEGWYVDNVAINGAIISNQDFTQQLPPPLNPIQTLSVNDLAPNTQRTLAFSVNTTSIPTGKYSVSALASPVQAEIDTQDNFYANGVVEVMINPDVDGDGDVDIFDVVAIASLYGCKEGDARWNPKADLVQDKVINIYDIVTVASHYGEKIP